MICFSVRSVVITVRGGLTNAPSINTGDNRSVNQSQAPLLYRVHRQGCSDLLNGVGLGMLGSTIAHALASIDVTRHIR